MNNEAVVGSAALKTAEEEVFHVGASAATSEQGSMNDACGNDVTGETNEREKKVKMSEMKAYKLKRPAIDEVNEFYSLARDARSLRRASGAALEKSLLAVATMIGLRDRLKVLVETDFEDRFCKSCINDFIKKVISELELLAASIRIPKGRRSLMKCCVPLAEKVFLHVFEAKCSGPESVARAIGLGKILATCIRDDDPDDRLRYLVECGRLLEKCRENNSFDEFQYEPIKKSEWISIYEYIYNQERGV